MQEPRLRRLATRVTLLQRSPAGVVTPVTIYKKKKRKKKKSSNPIMSVPKMLMDQMGNAQKAVTKGLKSSRRGRNGNLFKAIRKGGNRILSGRFPR